MLATSALDRTPASTANTLFADPAFPPPTVLVYEERMHSWAVPLAGRGIFQKIGKWTCLIVEVRSPALPFTSAPTL